MSASPWFAYLTLVLLQFKVVWQAWDYRDVTIGDTSSYFNTAWDWHENGRTSFPWSPLYTTYWGTILDITPDPVAATILHRLLIVFAASIMVLALLRRLVPPGLAWLTAAWWAILPINFNTLYEVHLFALLPVLTASLIVSAYRNSWGRGAALGVLATTTVLVRNEMSVASALWVCVCLGFEWRDWRGRVGSTARRLTQLAAAYGVPLILGLGVILFAYHRSFIKFGHGMSEMVELKHTLNMAQVYSFGYGQRHPEWTASPWTEYQTLMTETFGSDLPSLRKMIAANPRAVIEHFAWNVSLVPNGLQVLLFNATSGRRNPDYAPVNAHSRLARALSRVFVAIWIAGLIAMLRDRRHWWETCIQGRGHVWLLMACVAAVSLVVIPTQRPRPSYLFALSVFLMSITASFVHLLTSRLTTGVRAAQTLMPLAMIGLIAIVPSYFVAHAGPTPIRNTIRALQPYEELLSREGNVFVIGNYSYELKSYILHARQVSVHSYGFLSDWQPPETLDAFLTRKQVNLIYLDNALLTRLKKENAEAASTFLGTGNKEWVLIGCESLPGREWKLFGRDGAVPVPIPTSVDLRADLSTSGVHATEIGPDGWVGSRASFTLRKARGSRWLRIRGLVPSIDNPEFRTTAKVLLDGDEALSVELKPGDFELKVPYVPISGCLRVDLHFSATQPFPDGDRRKVSARLYSAETSLRAN